MPEHVMGDATRTRHDVVVEAVVQLVGRVPQTRAGPDLDGGDGDVQRVDEIGVEELPDDGRPAPEADVLPSGGLACLLQDGGRVGVDEVERGVRTKWNVVSDNVNDGRGWCVMTNTGVWNGGSSPHQPRQSWSAHGPRCGPNLLRPMTSAPMFRWKSLVK